MDLNDPLVVILLICGFLGGLAGLYFAIVGSREERARRERYELLMRQLEERRRQEIIAKRSEWGDDICRMLIKRQINVDMTTEMVQLALGAPDQVDQQEIMKSGSKERWIYGTPRQGAMYISFKNNQVVKIKK